MSAFVCTPAEGVQCRGSGLHCSGRPRAPSPPPQTGLQTCRHGARRRGVRPMLWQEAL